MVQPDEELIATGILGQVDEAGVAVFEDIIDQLLYDPEDDQLVLCLQPLAIVVKAGAGVHAARAADLLKEVIDGGLQPKVFEGWGHEAVGDVSDQLYGIVDDLFGVVNALQLGGLVEVDEVLVEVQTGGSEKGAGVIVEVGGDALAFFFLEADGGVQQQFLLVLFHALEPQLVPDDLSLVKDDENDKPDSERQHADSAEKEHQGNTATRTCDF